tara:strand:- start:1253 stop:1438 length:186 start_codon:yes stop_codon:yes gene_type:complete
MMNGHQFTQTMTNTLDHTIIQFSKLENTIEQYSMKKNSLFQMTMKKVLATQKNKFLKSHMN